MALPMEEALRQLAQSVPLEVFVIIGSVLEELIPPIPSPFVMSTAGLSLVNDQRNWMTFAWIAAVGAVGKTAASWVIYLVSDKFEDVIIGRFGKYLGVTHTQIEKLGSKLGNGWKDEVLLVAIRAIPLIPSFIISFGCGVLKTEIKSFLATTLIGSFLRNLLLLYISVVGFQEFVELRESTNNPTALTVAFVLAVIVVIVVGYMIKGKLSRKLGA